MSDARPIRLNEQLKGISSAFFNLGAAAIGASAARFVFNGEADWIGIGWIAGALVLIWLGTMVLGLMESETP